MRFIGLLLLAALLSVGAFAEDEKQPKPPQDNCLILELQPEGESQEQKECEEKGVLGTAWEFLPIINMIIDLVI